MDPIPPQFRRCVCILSTPDSAYKVRLQEVGETNGCKRCCSSNTVLLIVPTPRPPGQAVGRVHRMLSTTPGGNGPIMHTAPSNHRFDGDLSPLNIATCQRPFYGSSPPCVQARNWSTTDHTSGSMVTDCQLSTYPRLVDEGHEAGFRIRFRIHMKWYSVTVGHMI